MNDTREFLIWSIEHDAWWAPAERGYTRELGLAGRYPEARAREIVQRANIRHFHECLIPVDCVTERPTERPWYGYGNPRTVR